ncbi:SNF1-interacting protein, partial [Tieghemiomyces parasiticus]
MGNSHAKAHHGDTFDGGRFEPFGIYPDKDQDFDRRAVRRLILDRKIAPFYKGAEDTEDGSAEDTSGAPSSDLAADTSAAHMQPQASHESLHTATGATAPSVAPTPQRSRSDSTNCTVASAHPAPSTSCVNGRLRTGRPTAISPLAAVTTSATTPPRRSRTASACPYELTPDQERELLLRAVECPICFLYYPRHINYSRCCHHAICTECFVQIKRHEPILAPTTCPFCTQPDFGVTYAPPVAFCDRGSRSFSQ